jgi:hypothetical protein
LCSKTAQWQLSSNHCDSPPRRPRLNLVAAQARSLLGSLRCSLQYLLTAPTMFVLTLILTLPLSMHVQFRWFIGHQASGQPSFSPRRERAGSSLVALGSSRAPSPSPGESPSLRGHPPTHKPASYAMPTALRPAVETTAITARVGVRVSRPRPRTGRGLSVRPSNQATDLSTDPDQAVPPLQPSHLPCHAMPPMPSLQPSEEPRSQVTQPLPCRPRSSPSTQPTRNPTGQLVPPTHPPTHSCGLRQWQWQRRDPATHPRGTQPSPRPSWHGHGHGTQPQLPVQRSCCYFAPTHPTDKNLQRSKSIHSSHLIPSLVPLILQVPAVRQVLFGHLHLSNNLT